MNQNTVDIINSKIEVGYRYFYFDSNSDKLLISSKDGQGIDQCDTVRVYIGSNTTVEKLLRAIDWVLSFN